MQMDSQILVNGTSSHLSVNGYQPCTTALEMKKNPEVIKGNT
jgi:hypothetical protein